MNMQAALAQLLDGHSLSRADARDISRLSRSFSSFSGVVTAA